MERRRAEDQAREIVNQYLLERLELSQRIRIIEERVKELCKKFCMSCSFDGEPCVD